MPIGIRAWRFARPRKRVVVIVLRAERIGLRTLAARADRSLRTQAARRLAAEAHELAQRVAAHGASAGLRREHAVKVLTSRPSWARIDPDKLACSFGVRRIIVTLPAVATAEQLASIIARTEVRVLLGDADFGLVSHLQTFADRELQVLFSR